MLSGVPVIQKFLTSYEALQFISVVTIRYIPSHLQHIHSHVLSQITLSCSKWRNHLWLIKNMMQETKHPQNAVCPHSFNHQTACLALFDISFCAHELSFLQYCSYKTLLHKTQQYKQRDLILLDQKLRHKMFVCVSLHTLQTVAQKLIVRENMTASYCPYQPHYCICGCCCMF